jgi:thiamine-phosphate diphosphorylase/hydroxyethylthiazole kinase
MRIDIVEARKMLGPDKIIGVSAGTVQEAIAAAENGADYIGIGAIFATPTKTDTKSVLGPWGVRSILNAVDSYPNLRTVCIGGLNASNIQTVIYQSESSTRFVDGIAVVSAIMAAQNPEAEARRLLQLIKTDPTFKVLAGGRLATEAEDSHEPAIGELMMRALKTVSDQQPLSHNMTNLVGSVFLLRSCLFYSASFVFLRIAFSSSTL